MNLYNKINRKLAGNAAIAIVALSIISFLLGRPAVELVICLGGISDYLGFAFCNPTLWLTGQDHLMWEAPKLAHLQRIEKGNREFGLCILCFFSFVVHAALVSGLTTGLYQFYNRLNKK